MPRRNRRPNRHRRSMNALERRDENGTRRKPHRGGEGNPLDFLPATYPTKENPDDRQA